MNEEIKEDNNCIVKAFENNPIAILQEDIGLFSNALTIQLLSSLI